MSRSLGRRLHGGVARLRHKDIKYQPDNDY